MKDTDVHNQFIELRAKGWSYARIAEELNVSKQTLIEWGRQHKIDIANMQEVELDALRERHRLSHIHRLNTFGDQLGAITDELSKRDLSDVPTDKLLSLALRYIMAIREETDAPLFRALEDPVDNMIEDMKSLREWTA